METSMPLLVHVPLAQYALVYQAQSIGAKRMAIRLQAFVEDHWGLTLPIREDAEPETAYEILLGMTNRTFLWLAPLEYAVAVTNQKVYAAFLSMFAEEALLEFLKHTLSCLDKRPLVNGDLFTQDVTSLLTESQKNAHCKQGALRVMTANICGSYRCCEERMALLRSVFGEYAPDVLLVQESGPRWRENEKYLCNILWQDGYREARVEGVLNDNFNPVFYNARRFALVDAGYHPYSGANNANSKSVSWAVVTDQHTGQLLGFFSSHFYYTGDEVGRETRKRNAKELSELIQGLHRQFNCPFVGGGDFNCTCFDPPLQMLMERGFVDCHPIAGKRAQIGSMHSDPFFDPRLQMLTGCNNMDRSPDYRRHVIDHLLVYGARPQVLLHDVIADEHALAGTDHALVYMDLNLACEAV